MNNQNQYELLDSGNGLKLERFGEFTISRPSAQAVWRPQLPSSVWNGADAIFTRESEKKWLKKPSKEIWQVCVDGIKFKIQPTDFGHLGIFPEQADFWKWIQTTVDSAIRSGRKKVRVLNLFAYSGGASLAAAKAGAQVCHLDASKGMVAWAKENAYLNKLEAAPIRWIIDDVSKFLLREQKRGSLYEGIILDPPTFGRGAKGEVFKIETDLQEILSFCRLLLSPEALFLLFSCHTPGYTPVSMHHLLSQTMDGLPGRVDAGEMLLRGAESVLPLPSGSYARWVHNEL